MFYILDNECCCHPILLIVEMIADDWERQFGDDPDFQDQTSTKNRYYRTPSSCS